MKKDTKNYKRQKHRAKEKAWNVKNQKKAKAEAKALREIFGDPGLRDC